jgi:hypothetical protein
MLATTGRAKARNGLRPGFDGLLRLYSIPPSPAMSGFPKESNLTGRRFLRSCLLLDFTCYLAAGWWRTPSHKTPESLWLTEPTPRPMLGISGLLNLLTWVEHRQRAQASPHQEGGNPCPVSHPTRLPPTRFKPGNQSVGGSASGQSTATPLAAEPPTRTPTGTQQHTRQGGRR